MGRRHSEATRKKISQGVRRSREQKSVNRIKERFGSFFALGHPDRLVPTKVRSYGDLVRERGMAPEQHSAASLETHEERVERVNDMANALNLRRAKNIRDDNEGISGGTVEYNQPDTSLEKEEI